MFLIVALASWRSLFARATMRRMRKKMQTKSAVLIVVCAGVVAGSFAMLSAEAQPVRVTRWEMRCTPMPHNRNVQENADHLTTTGSATGREGWEPFAISNDMLCFKRAAQ
jgi:hypothetical protein